MKPLKLTISAFGSYADEQTVDFTKLGDNGLYDNVITALHTANPASMFFNACSSTMSVEPFITS